MASSIFRHSNNAPDGSKESVPFIRLSNKEELELARNLVRDSDAFDKIGASFYLRRLFINEHSQIQKDGATELIPLMLSFLKKYTVINVTGSSKEDTTLDEAKMNVTWALTNAVCLSKEHCHQVVELDGIHTLLNLGKKSPEGGNLRLQCAWAISNISVDCTDCKRAIRRAPAVEFVTACLRSGEYLSNSTPTPPEVSKTLRTLTWAAMNVVRCHTDRLPLRRILDTTVLDLVGVCSTLLEMIPRGDVIKNCIWILAHLADNADEGHQTDVIVNRRALISRVYSIFEKADLTQDISLQKACLRLFGNICVGTDAQTSAIVFHPLFHSFITRSLRGGTALRSEAIWICSNVAAGTVEHIEVLFDDEVIFHEILDGALRGDARLQKESLWTIVNLFLNANKERTSWMISTGVMSVFPHLLSGSSEDMVQRALSVLERILVDYPQYQCTVEKSCLLDKLHPNFAASPVIQEHKVRIAALLRDRVVDDLPTVTYEFEEL